MQGILFNSSSTILETYDWRKINLLNFANRKMKLLKNLEGADTIMNCFIFSKRQKTFICSDDSTIRIWKQQDNKEWIISDPKTQHKCAIMCSTLHEEEDTLFSGGADLLYQMVIGISKYEIVYQ